MTLTLSDNPMELTLDEYWLHVARTDLHEAFLEWVHEHPDVDHYYCTGVRLGEGSAKFELYLLDDDGKPYVDPWAHETHRYWKTVPSRRPPPIWKPVSPSFSGAPWSRTSSPTA